MGKVQKIADMLLARDEDDPFGYSKVKSWNKHAKSVDAMPNGITDLFKKKKKGGGGGEDPESRIRAANSVPEAMVKVASYGAGTASAKGQLDYVSRDGQLELELSDGTTIHDTEEAHALVDEWESDFHYRKGGSRNTMHMVVSTPNGSDPDGVLKAGREFAEATFGDNNPYALVRHDDGDHPHVHIVVKMRGHDGEMFRIERDGFQEMRETFAEKCRDNGIEMNATSREMRGTARSEPMALRKMREEGRTPEIDSRAAKIVAREKELPDAAKAAMEVRQSRLNDEAKAHRQMAAALSSIGNTNTPEGRAFEGEAEKLRELAGFLEEGGHVTRPERMRKSREDRMADNRQMDDDRAKAEKSKDGPDKERDPVKVLDDARAKVDRGIETARQITEKLPPGADRDKAEAALTGMAGIADRLHGREPERAPEKVEPTPPKPVEPVRAHTSEPEREMNASGLDKNVEKERVETGPTKDGTPEPAKEAPAPGSMKERMQKINERNAELAKDRERNPDADRDR